MADSSLISKNLIILLIFWSLCFSRTPGSRNEKYQDIFPEVTFEIQSTSNSYPKEKINAFVDSDILSLRNIYFEYLERGFDFEGDIWFKFTNAGNDDEVSILMHSTTENAEFDEIIKNKTAAWRWKAIMNNKTASITILFKFAILKNDKRFIVSGLRSDKEISRDMNVYPVSLGNIYKHFSKFKPDFRGKIILKFIVAGSGKITRVDIVASTTKYPEFDEAVKNKVATWPLKPTEKGSENDSTTITTVFIFYPSKYQY